MNKIYTSTSAMFLFAIVGSSHSFQTILFVTFGPSIYYVSTFSDIYERTPSPYVGKKCYSLTPSSFHLSKTFPEPLLSIWIIIKSKEKNGFLDPPPTNPLPLMWWRNIWMVPLSQLTQSRQASIKQPTPTLSPTLNLVTLKELMLKLYWKPTFYNKLHVKSA